jgi:hypothetical protein
MSFWCAQLLQMPMGVAGIACEDDSARRELTFARPAAVPRTAAAGRGNRCCGN